LCFLHYSCENSYNGKNNRIESQIVNVLYQIKNIKMSCRKKNINFLGDVAESHIKRGLVLWFSRFCEGKIVALETGILRLNWDF